MERQHWIRNRVYAVYFTIVALFAVSCGEGPVPGPISPSHSLDKRDRTKAKPEQSSSATVRPVKRLDHSTPQSLAKSGYDQAKVLQELQDVRDEMKAIVDKNLGASIANKLNGSVEHINDAIGMITSSSSDEEGEDEDEGEGQDEKKVLKKLNKAKTKIQEAINSGLLLFAHGEQFKNQLTEIENQISSGASALHDYRGQSKYLWIKRNYGGLIKLGGHSVDVPKYATKQDAEFSINISPNDYITVDFGPDGWFDQPVTVTISYKDADLTGINPLKLTLAWYDESTGQWIDLGGVVDLVKKTVTAKAWHFTQYTISTK